MFSSTASPRREVLEVAEEVAHAEAGARRLAGVGGSDALLGGSNAESQPKRLTAVEHRWVAATRCKTPQPDPPLRFPLLGLSLSLLQAIDNLVEVKHWRHSTRVSPRHFQQGV